MRFLITLKSIIKGAAVALFGREAASPEPAVPWEHFKERMDLRVRDVGWRARGILLEELQKAAPRRTGKGARSIRAVKTGGMFVTETYRFEALGYMLFTVPPGTRPHEIRPRKAKVLRFSWERGPHGPGTYFFARVMHPGYRPQKDWREEAMRKAERRLSYMFGRGRLFEVEQWPG